jgi:Spy/CpxP family protein refolding chaperone
MNCIRRIARTALIGTALCVAPVTAQQTPPPTAVSPRAPVESELFHLGLSRDPLADAFFPPDLVMQHQQAIGLTGEQRAQIVNIIAQAQPRFVEAQWQLQPETTALAELVRGDRVNEQQVLAQIDRVLDIERQIKRLQIEMLIRIKNQLTLEQQQQLARLGGVRLRGYLDSGRKPFGLGLAPNEWDSWDEWEALKHYEYAPWPPLG